MTVTVGDGRHNVLRARQLGLDTQQEAVVFMRKDCPVCRSEGFEARARVVLSHGGRSIIATLYQTTADVLGHDEAGLSDSAFLRLGVRNGDEIEVHHPQPLASLRKVRARIYGDSLDDADFGEVIRDVVAGRYSDIHLSSLITAISARPLDGPERIALTRAMVEAGDRLRWPFEPVVDKHCVGGLPGNRTTPIIAAIAAANGLYMPKTSSRAITSPAGTADTMETMAPVTLDIPSMQRVVEQEGACVVWGGSVRLSPADDILIRVERALELDSEGQLVASVLSKKIAAGATRLVLDVPVGPTAKVRDAEAASAVSSSLAEVAAAFGIECRVVVTDGSQPVGRGIGPALEARDVLAILQRAPGAPEDLRDRAVDLAAALLELGGAAAAGAGEEMARQTLDSGRAWEKFQRICEAQGGMRTPPEAGHRRDIVAARSGRVTGFDNRRLATVAKLAGAPEARAAGVELRVHVGAAVEAGAGLYTIHAESPGELAYAAEFALANGQIVVVGL